MRSPVDHDVIIAGGGPAGLSTWLHLHALAPEIAAHTLLIERETYPRDKLCGGGVTPLADSLLDGLELQTTCPSVPVHRIEFRFGDRRYVFERDRAFRVVRRRQFDHELALTAAARGLKLQQGESVTGFTSESDAVVVQTTQGAYRTRVLVGADGAQSMVRRGMGLVAELHLARLLEVITPVDTAHDPEFAGSTALFDFSAAVHGLQGYVWHFPCLDDDRPSMNRGICDTRIHPERERADLRTIFSAALQARNVERPPHSWESHPVRWFSDDEALAQPHVMLVGDAAGIDPALGEGISQSLDYGDFAANVLIDAFARGDFSFATHRQDLLRHPLGQALRYRARLAREMYAPHPQPLEHLFRIVTEWLAVS